MSGAHFDPCGCCDRKLVKYIKMMVCDLSFDVQQVSGLSASGKQKLSSDLIIVKLCSSIILANHSI